MKMFMAVRKSMKVMRKCRKAGEQFEKREGRKATEVEALEMAWQVLQKHTGKSREDIAADVEAGKPL